MNTLWAQTPWGTDIKYTNEGRDGNDYQFTAYQVVYSPNKGQFGTWENLNYFGTNGLNVTSKWIPAKAAMMPAAASATTITSPTSWGVTSLWEEAGALGRSIWSTLAGAGATATVIIGSLSIPSSERVTDKPADVAVPTHGNDKNSQNPQIVYQITALHIPMLNAEILKYGVADAKFNTFANASNRRPESQLAYFREERPDCMVNYSILARPEGRDLAYLIEAGFVASYMRANFRPTFLPPEYQFRPIPDIGFKFTP